MIWLTSARARLTAFLRSSWRTIAGTELTRADRVLHFIALAACTFFAAAAFWESFGPERSGHFSTGSAYAMAGENMVHWGKFAVYNGYLAHPAAPDQYYCHHPYGISILEAIAYVVFGHHWFTPRAPAIFCSVFSAPLVYAFGRQAWGVIPAAVATVLFAFIPIDLAFAAFSNLEEPTIFFGLLFAWATARLWASWQTRYVVLSAIGALGCSQGDWVGLLFIGVPIIFGFVRAYVFPRRWYGRLDERLYAQWFAYGVAMAIGTLVLYLALFAKVDKLGDLMSSYHLRSAGAEAPIESVFSDRRKLWLGTMLTPIALGAIALGAPLALARLVQKPLEIFPLAWLLAASFQYFVFKQGADIHIFWPHYYAPAAAFAAGSLAATLLAWQRAVVAWAVRATKPGFVQHLLRDGSGVLIGVTLGVPLLLLARIGVPELVQSRRTAGRFDHGGHYLATDADASQFAEWAFSNVATAGSTIQALEKFDYNFSVEYGGDRPYVRVQSLTVAKPEDVQRIALVDTRNQPVKELESIAKQFGVQAVGPFWRVDRAQKGPSLVARRYEEREPSPLEWAFVTGTDLVRTISKDEDVYATWEWRDALNLPAEAPEAAPITPDELRIAHNIAVLAKDQGRASELRGRLTRLMGQPETHAYSGGVKLVGIDIQDGAATVVSLYWETDETWKHPDVTYQVKCKIVKRPRLWPTLVDYFEKDMAPVPPIRPASWKPGYLYAQRFVAAHRIGREECRGSFTGDLKPLAGDANPVLFTLE